MLEEALRESEFQLILNANPGSRVRVEAGRTKGGYMGLRGTSELPFQANPNRVGDFQTLKALSLSRVCPVCDFRIAIPSTKLMPKLLHKLG